MDVVPVLVFAIPRQVVQRWMELISVSCSKAKYLT